MKTVIFCTVAWKYENEKYERFSMDKESYADFKKYIDEYLGKIIQEEEVPFNECTQEFQTNAKEKEKELTNTEQIISKSGKGSITL